MKRLPLNGRIRQSEMTHLNRHSYEYRAFLWQVINPMKFLHFLCTRSTEIEYSIFTSQLTRI